MAGFQKDCKEKVANMLLERVMEAKRVIPKTCFQPRVGVGWGGGDVGGGEGGREGG